MDLITLAMAKAYSDSKGGYSKTDTVLQTVCHADSADATMYNVGDFVPEVGKTYKVTVDGVTSTQTAVRIEADGMEYAVLGNLAIVGMGDDSGEDYVIVVTPEVKALMHRTKQYPETIALTIKTETIHPIDPKYLPEMKSTVEVWDAASVIDEREIDNSMDNVSVAGKYSVSRTVAYDFDGVLTKLKTTVESGGTFMASIMHGNLIPVCYSDTAITFVYCNGTARLDITISDNTVKYIGFAPV